MSQISLPLDIDSLKILSQTVDANGNIIIEVQSKGTSTPAGSRLKCNFVTESKHKLFA